MNTRFVRFFAAVLAGLLLTGCATQNYATKEGQTNPFCLLAGAVGGGGIAAALGAAAGPIGAGAVLGTMIAGAACSEPAASPPAVATIETPAETTMPEPRDTDGDGVVDADDRCPDTPVGVSVDARGCPKILLTLNGLNFKFDRAEIEPRYADILDQAVVALQRNADVDVRIEGHTDSVGSEPYNMKLSQRRADAVRNYLVRHGIAAARLRTLGFGETRPVATNATAEGRFQNRRVELHVIAAEGEVASGP